MYNVIKLWCNLNTFFSIHTSTKIEYNNTADFFLYLLYLQISDKDLIQLLDRVGGGWQSLFRAFRRNKKYSNCGLFTSHMIRNTLWFPEGKNVIQWQKAVFSLLYFLSGVVLSCRAEREHPLTRCKYSSLLTAVFTHELTQTLCGLCIWGLQDIV